MDSCTGGKRIDETRPANFRRQPMACKIIKTSPEYCCHGFGQESWYPITEPIPYGGSKQDEEEATAIAERLASHLRARNEPYQIRRVKLVTSTVHGQKFQLTVFRLRADERAIVTGKKDMVWTLYKYPFEPNDGNTPEKLKRWRAEVTKRMAILGHSDFKFRTNRFGKIEVLVPKWISN